ncbi:hypothetical protein P3X46_032105 [Hevea brasiliensis]|uniref:Serine aminopeptidase S33 domain-containing protein n=1 Tax=Hevea brasiliensis TaxID=3981 RepID=A0ABQ9KQI2_HEVBR|nr:hypothetical protein P3X46_032105 [Hevea brasiliensis]
MAMEQSAASSSLILTSGASGRVNPLFSVRALKILLLLINAVVLLLLLPFRGPRRTVHISSSMDKPKDFGKLQECGPQRKMVRVPATIVPWKSSAWRRIKRWRPGGPSQSGGCYRMMPEFGEGVFAVCYCHRRHHFYPVVDPCFCHNQCLLTSVAMILGLNEHSFIIYNSGRYSDFAKQLNAHGFKVYGMDWIGHGGSDGLHAYVHSPDYAVSDFKSFLDKVLGDNPGLQPSAANKKGMPVSRDREALIAKYSEPLVYTGSIRVRTGYEILQISNYLQQNFKLHKNHMTKRLLHDLLLEPEGQDIVNDIIEWLHCRV